jgi:hypothetical protein
MSGLFFIEKKLNMKNTFMFFLYLCFSCHLSAQCDTSQRPVVFIHGFLASGDTYAGQIQRFTDKGYCPNRLFLFDWNAISGSGNKTDFQLKNFIDSILKLTGASQIDLVGHSAGGGLGRGLLMDSVYAAKVAHYIHLGSRKWFYEYSWFPNSRCLNIYSSVDMVTGKSGGEVDGALNLDLRDKDHYEVATSKETFDAIYNFISGNRNVPAVPSPSPGRFVEIAGKAVYLGDNLPMHNAGVNIYKLNPKTGSRRSSKPDAVFRADADGRWGPFQARKNIYYEIELIPAEKNGRIISYFYRPFIKSDWSIYLRGFPAGNLMGMMLGMLPANEGQSLIVIYSSSHAIIAGRDSVSVNGIPVTSALLTPAAKTVISHFIFDDGDGQTSGKAHPQFSVAPFLAGADIYLPAKEKSHHTIYFNNKKLNLPAVSSKERILLAVF